MKYVIPFLMSLLLILPLSSQERVTEQVSIDWWVLPLFVVDKKGDPILDLKDTDVELLVNNKAVTGFTLYKRAFTVESKAAEKPLPIEKEKVIFLLFDTAFTTQENFERSKAIARDMVQKADAATLFSVMAVDPMAGPVYGGGPSANKKEVIKMIENTIKWVPNAKSISAVLKVTYGTQVYGKFSRLSADEVKRNLEQRSSGLKKSNQNYFLAFQTLYHALNSIKDNKFIYLFSEGISLFARQVLAHAAEEYWFFIKQTAGYLGRCGAVLFIINPAGARLDSTSMASGEDSLRFLARESGGKYIEGEEKHITGSIAMMNRAYYEVAFPEQEGMTGNIRQVAVRPLRKGINIHTLRNLEKGKTYSEMNSIEREVLVVTLLNPSPLFHAPLKTSHLDVEKSPGKEGELVYKIKLPADFKQKSLELYKVKVDPYTNQAAVKKEAFTSTEKPLQLTVKKEDEAVMRMVLVNGSANTALVQGIFNAEAEKASILSDKADDFKKQIERMAVGEKTELGRITLGAAKYCYRLSEAVFHYVCKEKVSEVLDDIRVHKQVREAEMDRNTGSYRAAFNAKDDRRIVRRKLTNKYVNDYQLVSKNGRLIEQRNLIKGKMKKVGGKEGLLKLDAFISRKVSLSPLTLLGPGSQDRFFYRFIKHEKLKGVKTAVIECFPKDPKKARTIFGRLWVDLEDYSIMRITVNPVSIGGYTELLKRARYYNSKLILTCQIDFYMKRKGIRFPTKVLVREVYSGGKELRDVVRKPIWERSKTTYIFDDYRFFDVDAQSDKEAVKK